MAGFKRTIRDFNPIWFLSFDGDHVIGSTGIIDNDRIIDEIGNTEGIIHDEHGILKGYYAGLASHIEPEQTNQASIRFGVNTRHPMALSAGVSLAPCSYVEVPNKTDSYWNKDEFTLIYTIKKDKHAFANWEWLGEIKNSTKINSMTETTMRLGNIFEFRTVFVHAGCSTSHIDMFMDDTNTPLYTESSSCYVSDAPLHIGFNVVEVGSPRASFCVIRFKNGVFEYIVDGHHIFTKDLKTVSGYDPAIHTVPNMINTIKSGLSFDEMTFFLGGKPTNEIRVTTPKYQTISRTEFDQMALFNKYINDDDVMRLYRRVWYRNTMYGIESPSLYMPMNEKPHQINGKWSITSRVNDYYLGGGYINGNVNSVSPRHMGRYVDEYGIRFTDNGFTLPMKKSSLNLNNDFTFEFSVKGYSSKRACIFQTMEVNSVNEFSLYGNSNDGTLRIGWCDLRHANGQIFSFPCDLLDDEWHRVVIRKRGNVIDLYVDETIYIDGLYSNMVQELQTNTVFFRGFERDSQFEGTLSEILIYEKALTDIILKAHVNFDYLYRVNGQINKAGHPFKAKIRVYSHYSGKLLAETESDSLTGNFNVYLSSNETVDLMLVEDVGSTVQIQAVGLIDPDVVNDTTISIP